MIPGSRRSPGEGNGNPLQYSCLENPMDRGVWQATVHKGHKESDMVKVTEHTHICIPTKKLLCFLSFILPLTPLVVQTVKSPSAMQETWV